MRRGRIILLNGVSSSGKTTLARGLVARLPDHFHFSSDDYDLLIERMEDRERQRLIPVETEVFVHRTLRMFADCGVNLIADLVLHDAATLEDFQRTLSGYPVFAIGVHCPPEILTQREAQRGDRRIGLAQSQLAFVHQSLQYDLEVDTHHHSLEHNLELICQRLR